MSIIDAMNESTINNLLHIKCKLIKIKQLKWYGTNGA